MFHGTRWKTVLMLAFMAFSTALLAADKPLLTLERDVPLTGGVSRFDYQALNPQDGLLYISHMGAGQIVVFNTKTNQPVTNLSGFPSVTGVFVLPEIHRLFASVTGRHQVALVDAEKLKVLNWLPGGRFPDGMAYVPELHQLYVSDEMGGGETVIDVLNHKRLINIQMGGEVGNTRYDPVSHLIFANVQTKNELVAIDPQTRKIVGRHPVKGGNRPHGLWIEADSRLAFLACEGDSKLVVMDLNNYEEVGVFDVGEDPDVLSYDSDLKVLYVAAEKGKVSLFSLKDKKVQKLGDVEVGNNSHSVQVDPQTHLVYFPLRKVGKGPVLRIMKPNF
jgi:DNA-binding beta-propeller fold protein YncE